MLWFRNYNRCARCGQEWVDDWSATCDDDDCPHCGARQMSPYKSEDIDPPNPARRVRPDTKGQSLDLLAAGGGS